MSLTQTIADLVVAADAQRAQVAQWLGETNAKMTEALAKVATLERAYFVDQVAGLDTNAGTEAAPLKTVSRALANTPYGGSCVISFLNDYVFTAEETVTIRGQAVKFYGGDILPRPVISFERVVDGPNRRCGGINFYGRCFLHINYCTVHLPAASGEFAGLGTTVRSSPIRHLTTADAAFAQLAVTYCDVSIPVANFGPLAFFYGSTSLYWINNTLTGEDLKGRLLAGYTNPAGTDTTTATALVTNLALV